MPCELCGGGDRWIKTCLTSRHRASSSRSWLRPQARTRSSTAASEAARKKTGEQSLQEATLERIVNSPNQLYGK